MAARKRRPFIQPRYKHQWRYDSYYDSDEEGDEAFEPSLETEIYNCRKCGCEMGRPGDIAEKCSEPGLAEDDDDDDGY